jgi:hypothetical protein
MNRPYSALSKTIRLEGLVLTDKFIVVSTDIEPRATLIVVPKDPSGNGNGFLELVSAPFLPNCEDNRVMAAIDSTIHDGSLIAIAYEGTIVARLAWKTQFEGKRLRLPITASNEQASVA